MWGGAFVQVCACTLIHARSLVQKGDNRAGVCMHAPLCSVTRLEKLEKARRMSESTEATGSDGGWLS